MNVRKLVFISFSAALIVALKEALSFLPNIELVTFCLMLYATVFELKTSIYISILFCMIQTLLYGLGTWTICYFIVWPLLVFTTYLLKNHLTKKADYMALYAGAFGLLFGSFFAIPYLIIGGPKMAISYIISGFVFDVIHMGGNYIIMLLLFNSVYKQLLVMQKKFRL